jgi:hypothetical protein
MWACLTCLLDAETATVLDVVTPDDTTPPTPRASLTEVTESSFKVSVTQNEPGGVHYLLVLPMEAEQAAATSAVSTGELQAVNINSLSALSRAKRSVLSRPPELLR